MTDVSNKMIKTAIITTIKVAMPKSTKPVVIFDGSLFPSRSLLKPQTRRVMPKDKQMIKPRMIISGENTNRITKTADLYMNIRNNRRAVSPVNKTLSTIQPARTFPYSLFLFPPLTKSPPVTARATIAMIINTNSVTGPMLYIILPLLPVI